VSRRPEPDVGEHPAPTASLGFRSDVGLRGGSTAVVTSIRPPDSRWEPVPPAGASGRVRVDGRDDLRVCVSPLGATATRGHGRRGRFCPGPCSTAGPPAGSTATVGECQRWRRIAVRESGGSGFDSVATALLPCSTPRNAGRSPDGTGSIPPSPRIPRPRVMGGWCGGKPPGLTPRSQPSNV